jgi:hypothetical protein
MNTLKRFSIIFSYIVLIFANGYYCYKYLYFKSVQNSFLPILFLVLYSINIIFDFKIF